MQNDESFPLSPKVVAVAFKKRPDESVVETPDKLPLDYYIQDIDSDTVHLVLPKHKKKKGQKKN